jgi:hypothetical protein
MAAAETTVGCAPSPPASTPASATPTRAEVEVAVAASSSLPKDKFIPLTVAAIVDRLAAPGSWPRGQARAARRFFRYLDYWRRQKYAARLIELQQTYEPFSPDSDLFVTREYTAEERGHMQRRLVADVEKLLVQANYHRIDPTDIQVIMTKDSTYGLDLHVDFTAFEECLIYFRGATTKRDKHRDFKRFYLKEEFDVPIYQRLFLLFKLKPFEVRVHDLMASEKLTRKEAERAAKRLRAMIPENVRDDHVYMKLFKNIPRNDIEMIFPNTRVRFRMFDKVKLGVTSGGALGAGVFGTASKVAAGGLIVSNPVALAGAVAALGGVAFRQAMNFVNQKNRYMVVMAQNLYFHAMADNRGVMIKLADRAAEEDVKEEILLYCVLAKEPAKRADLPAIDAAIEQYLATTFGINIDFDLHDALGRLLADGVITEDADGTLHTLPPHEAAKHIDTLWDLLLDELPDFGGAEEGEEIGDGAN